MPETRNRKPDNDVIISHGEKNSATEAECDNGFDVIRRLDNGMRTGCRQRFQKKRPTADGMRLQTCTAKYNVVHRERFCTCTHGWRRGAVVSGVRRMNVINARRARLVRGWVTVFGRVCHLGM